MNENKQSKILQQQKALLDAIESMDRGEAVVEEWQPSLDVEQALFIEDIERERARRQIVTVSQAPPGRKFILAVLRQSLPIITPSLPVGLNTPEYERKEE